MWVLILKIVCDLYIVLRRVQQIDKQNHEVAIVMQVSICHFLFLKKTPSNSICAFGNPLKETSIWVCIKVGEARVVTNWITALTCRARTMVHVYRGRNRTRVAVRTALWVCVLLLYHVLNTKCEVQGYTNISIFQRFTCYSLTQSKWCDCNFFCG